MYFNKKHAKNIRNIIEAQKALIEEIIDERDIFYDNKDYEWQGTTEAYSFERETDSYRDVLDKVDYLIDELDEHIYNHG